MGERTAQEQLGETGPSRASKGGMAPEAHATAVQSPGGAPGRRSRHARSCSYDAAAARGGVTLDAAAASSTGTGPTAPAAAEPAAAASGTGELTANATTASARVACGSGGPPGGSGWLAELDSLAKSAMSLQLPWRAVHEPQPAPAPGHGPPHVTAHRSQPPGRRWAQPAAAHDSLDCELDLAWHGGPHACRHTHSHHGQHSTRHPHPHGGGPHAHSRPESGAHPDLDDDGEHDAELLDSWEDEDGSRSPSTDLAWLGAGQGLPRAAFAHGHEAQAAAAPSGPAPAPFPGSRLRASVAAFELVSEPLGPVAAAVPGLAREFVVYQIRVTELLPTATVLGLGLGDGAVPGSAAGGSAGLSREWTVARRFRSFEALAARLASSR